LHYSNAAPTWQSVVLDEPSEYIMTVVRNKSLSIRWQDRFQNTALKVQN